MPKGFVYVLSNPAIPGLLKIGFTTKVPTERVAELNTTGVPASFVLEYYCLTDRADELEATVHERLVATRQSRDREFFKTTVYEAVAAIEQASPSREHTWSRQPIPRLRPTVVNCQSCGAGYVSAAYCPRCRVKLVW